VSAARTFLIDPARVRAAVFDLGGVLIGGGPSEVVAFGKRIGLAPSIWETLRRDIFGNDGCWARLERGELPFDDFIDELKIRIRHAGGSVSDEEALSFMGEPQPMADPASLRPEMVEAVRALRERMPTALLTNNVREWRDGWRSAVDLDALFDVVVDSSEVGARKPEPRIYEITRERLGVAHDEILFIDDIGQNLKAARALGWQTLLYTEMEAVLAEVARVLAAAT
jgi:putative hydrolase of the HAD superfamily